MWSSIGEYENTKIAITRGNMVHKETVQIQTLNTSTHLQLVKLDLELLSSTEPQHYKQ